MRFPRRILPPALAFPAALGPLDGMSGPGLRHPCGALGDRSAGFARCTQPVPARDRTRGEVKALCR